MPCGHILCKSFGAKTAAWVPSAHIYFAPSFHNKKKWFLFFKTQNRNKRWSWLIPSRTKTQRPSKPVLYFLWEWKWLTSKKPPERCKLPFQRNCAVFVMDKFKETARIILICGVAFLPLIWSLKKINPTSFFILAPITIQTPPTNENSPKTEHLLLQIVGSCLWNNKLFI